MTIFIQLNTDSWSHDNRTTSQVQFPTNYSGGLRFEHTSASTHTKLWCCFGFCFRGCFGLISNDGEKKGNFQNPCLVAKFNRSMSEVCWKRRVCASIITIFHATFLMPCPRNMHSTCPCVHIDAKNQTKNTWILTHNVNRHSGIAYTVICAHTSRTYVYRVMMGVYVYMLNEIINFMNYWPTLSLRIIVWPIPSPLFTLFCAVWALSPGYPPSSISG